LVHPVIEKFHVETLSTQDRSGFECGVAALDRYLKEQAGQDQRRGVSNCFLALSAEKIAGYYTFAAAGVPFRDLPTDISRRLPRYSDLPGALIGRLAVDRRFRGLGLGAGLIADAMMRARLAAPAVFMLLVDAKDEKAAEFYRHHAFRSLEGRPLRLFLTMSTAEKVPGLAGRGGSR
jgi:GNAT superfamily N-acetyltransferase